jgi:hypothetical protein
MLSPPVSGQLGMLLGFVVTLVTSIQYSFMLRLLVFFQTTLFIAFVATLVTSVQYSIFCLILSHLQVMLRHNVSAKNTRCLATDVTFFTAKPLTIEFGELVLIHPKVPLGLASVSVGCHEATGSSSPDLALTLGHST